MKVSKLTHRTRILTVIGAAAVAALTFTACSGGGGTSGDSADSGNDNSASGVNIVIIGGSGDPFFSTVQKGVDAATQAVEAAGGKVTYLALKNYNNLGPDTAELEKTAIAQNASVIAVPNWVPEAQNEQIQAAIDKGIPVIIYNAGGWELAQELDALTYIGSDDEIAGEAAGKALVEAGSKNAVCVNTVPGAANTEARCEGLKKGMEAGGGTSTSLNLPATSFGSPTAVTQAIKSSLLQDDSIDGAVTIGAADADAAAAAVEQATAGDRVKLVSFDLSTSVLDRIKGGTQFAAIDQQGYAQGYYSVSAAFQYVAYGIELPTKPLLTGPLVVDASNVDAALDGTKAGTR